MLVNSEHGDGDHDAELAGEIIRDLTDVVGALTRVNDLIADHLGVGTTDLQCLHVLNREAPSTAGNLSVRLGRTTGAVTHMIDRLEKAGFVRRGPDPTDRRRVVIEPDAEGLKRVGEFYSGLERRSRDLLAGYTLQQLRVIHSFIAASLENSLGEADALARERR